MGHRPAARRARARGSASPGLLSRLTRSGGTNADTATGLLLAGALALGSILASDVYRSGVGVDRLLFGTLLGLSDGDLWLAAAAAVAAVLATAALARTWLATGFDPGGARALGVPAARGDWLLLALLAACVVAVLPAVGALLVSTLLVVPGRDRAAADRVARRACSRPGSRWPPPRASTGLLLAYHLDFPPGPAIAIVGGGVFALARPVASGDAAGDRGTATRGPAPCHARPRVSNSASIRRRARPTPPPRASRSPGSPRPTTAARPPCATSRSPRSPARRSRSSDPTAAARRRCFGRCSASSPTVTGSAAIGGAAAYVPQTERSRLDFPVSRARRRAHGRLRADARGSGAIRAADRALATAALARVGLAEHADKRFGALSGGQRQRVLIARALVQDAGVLLLDEPFAGVDQTSEEAIMGILDELRAEGRVLLIATHDVEQARRWDRVLCLRGEQIAYGPPADTLTNAVLEATYGAEIVLLDCGHRAVAVQHHDHAH